MEFDRSKFIGQFRAETHEHLQKLSAGFLKLEKRRDDKALLDEMMREAHTIKGSATMMGYQRIADIAHEMETGFQKALAGEVRLVKAHFDLLFKCIDTIGPLLEDKVTWEDKGIGGSFVDRLCNRIAATFSADGDRRENEPPKRKSKAMASAATEAKAPEKIEAPTQTAKSADPSTMRDRSPAVFHSPEESLRVDINKLDKLMNLSGELMVSQVRLNELVKNLARKIDVEFRSDETFATLAKDLKRVDEEMAFVSTNIQDEMTKVRLIPVAHLFNLFPRAMRDLAHEAGKEIELSISGEDTHLDKAIIDEMKDPIMHILRNAVDHGIESPEERAKHNKPPVGAIALKAFQVGSQVVIEISEDGAGIDILKVKEKAVAKGIITKDKVEELNEEQAYQLLFLPGFSTKDEVTETSGRGVGLDVVRERLAKLKGTVEIVSARHKGTTFIIKLPLTLAITEILLVTAGSETFAMPIDAVVETIRIELGEIRSVETREAITVRGQIMPIVRLSDIFGIPPKGIIERKYFPVVVVQAVEKKIGILVDTLQGRLNIVSKMLGDPVRSIRFISGATILGDGRVILILDIPMIIDSFETGAVAIKRQTLAPSEAVKPAKKRRKTILLAEDAITTAMLEKSILESAGFSVVLAKDGQEALEKSQQEKFDMVITDVLMPRMDGFDLTATLKKDKLYKDIPVIIVTTRESDADKRRGLEAGADAYILKSEFTSEGLLNTIERLIG